MAEHDEWKGGGFCPECRRRQFCKADCKPGRAYKITRVQRMIYWDMVVMGKEPRPEWYKQELRDENAVMNLIRWAKNNLAGGGSDGKGDCRG